MVFVFADIDGTLSSIKPVGQSASSSNEEGTDCIDFASDGELYLDSVDGIESSSDPGSEGRGTRYK